ncbi:hypothetical protein AB0K40_46725, partial [Nonomuraea bangladeshensis]
MSRISIRASWPSGQVNADQASYATVKKFAILAEDFTVESGELTASLKSAARSSRSATARPWTASTTAEHVPGAGHSTRSAPGSRRTRKASPQHRGSAGTSMI